MAVHTDLPKHFICAHKFLSQGSPLPLLLDDEMASLVDLGIGTDATILVDEAS